MNNLFWVEINLSNLKSNIHNLKSLLNSKTKFMAVVKSNAYGHGMVEVAKVAVEAGADWLGVVSLDEAMRLRMKEARPPSLKTPILILGFVNPKNMKEAVENDISMPIVSLDHLKNVTRYTLHATRSLKVHLKIETGINRLGLQIDEIPRAFEMIKNNKNIVLEGVYSHFASVEEQNIDYANKQLMNFQKAIDLLHATRYTLYDELIRHISSSAATMLIPEAHFDMVRCGIAIYGLWPSAETQNEFLKIRNPKSEIRNKSKIINSNFLKPVLSFKTKIVQIKEVKVGDKIGYGCTFEVKKPMTIAVIPVGYFEGMDRGLSNPNTCIHLRGVCKGEVLVCGKRCPIVGRICMNMSVINITQIRNTKSEIRNSEVVIIGKQASRQARGAYAEITADEIAKKIGTINYEIVTRIPEYIKRVYK